VAGKYMRYLEDTRNTIYLSSISIAEIMVKKSIGSLNFDADIFEICNDMDIHVLDFDGLSAFGLGALPFHHKDPFDRMIISQAIAKKYKLISVDQKFSMYECELL
jgi:PIN domain nuclease of toxin-antitoxin system